MFHDPLGPMPLLPGVELISVLTAMLSVVS